MMSNNTHIISDTPRQSLAMNPKKFVLWLFIATIIMMFGGFTSAFIVMASEKAIQEIQLPGSLLTSTIVILMSSLTIQLALYYAKKDELKKITVYLSVTLILGIVFLYYQFVSWDELVLNNVTFVSNNPTGSFIYVFTGMHGLHIVSALIFLIIVFVSSIKLNIHSKKLNQIEMCVTYWHFLGILWLYLYIFLTVNF